MRVEKAKVGRKHRKYDQGFKEESLRMVRHGQSVAAVHGFQSSMMRRDNHYDNAMGESLFSRFKAELMQKGAFCSFEDAYTEIFEYIEIYYNTKRRHSGINHKIPEQFEQKWEQNPCSKQGRNLKIQW